MATESLYGSYLLDASSQLCCQIFMQKQMGSYSKNPNWNQVIANQRKQRYKTLHDLTSKQSAFQTIRQFDDETVVLKLIKKPTSTPALQQANMFKTNFDHANLVRVLDAFFVKWNGENVLWLELEWCDGGTLRTFIKQRKGQRLGISVLQWWMREVASGIQYLHHANLVHGNISPKTILLKSENGQTVAKVAGFCEKPKLSRFFYWSPDMMKNGVCRPKDDIWSLGVTFYQLAMLTLNFPFVGIRVGFNTNPTAELVIDRSAISQSIVQHYKNEALCDTLLSMLDDDTTRRVSIDQLIDGQIMGFLNSNLR